MKQVGIIGGAGYTAGELIRILINHKKVSIKFVYSTTQAGRLVSEVHQDLLGDSELLFTNTFNPEIDLLFLCLGHGNSRKFTDQNQIDPKTKIIDLSQDFRLKNNSSYKNSEFVYGLPELNKVAIKKAQYIANPGCFATAIQLALLPLASKNLLNNEVHVNAVTGATGAGVSLSKTTHFTYRDNNFSYYKPFEHQHLNEIDQSLLQLQDTYDKQISFIPNRGNFSRGIFASLYTKYDGSLEQAKNIYKQFYNSAPFTHISDQEIHLKQVTNTNKCLLHLFKYKDKLLISSVLDNLLKGAAGQAIENMNLLFGFDQDDGLQLKGSFF